MMDYYIIVNEDEPIFLGAQSFGFFYPDTGFDLLLKISDIEPELIKVTKIITDTGDVLDVEKFLSLFEDSDDGPVLKIRRRS